VQQSKRRHHATCYKWHRRHVPAQHFTHEGGIQKRQTHAAKLFRNEKTRNAKLDKRKPNVFRHIIGIGRLADTIERANAG
jgi:diacylglycerol kinase family enzyme